MNYRKNFIDNNEADGIRRATNFEIHIFKGDPTKGHIGWMYSLYFDDKRFTSTTAYPSRTIAAATALEDLRQLEEEAEAARA